MSRISRQVMTERAPLPIGTSLFGGGWAVAEFVAGGGRHLCYKGMGRALRKAALREYFPLNWLRAEAGPSPCSNPEIEADLRQFFLTGIQLGKEIAHHPSLRMVYEFSEADQTYYLAEEWVEGSSLAELVKAKGALSFDNLAPILTQVGGAISHLHSQGFLHRDVSPHNILVDLHGKAKLTDFETVSPYPKARNFPRITISNPFFAPIELLSPFSSYGPESDVYGLAASVYMALVGRAVPPAANRTASPALPPAHLLNPRLPKMIADALARGLQVRSKDRTSSVDALLADLGL